MIIETCPKCGHDLVDLILASNPPIPKKECLNCGWSWTGKPEAVIRVPFRGDNDIFDATFYLNTNIDGTIDITTMLHNYLNNLSHEDARIGNFDQPACINCSSNPKNGGDGICFCTLGQQVTY